MGCIFWFDKVRYIPGLNLVTLFVFAVDSLRYPGRISRAAKMYFTMVGYTLLSGIICTLLSWTPEWVLGIFFTCCLYGIVVGTVASVRNEILRLNSQ